MEMRDTPAPHEDIFYNRLYMGRLSLISFQYRFQHGLQGILNRFLAVFFRNISYDRQFKLFALMAFHHKHYPEDETCQHQ